jgi:hypothetical protein
MTLLGLLGGYFTLFAAGFGVVLLLTKDAARINAIECACLSWLFGVGIVSLSLWVGGMRLSGLALQGFATAVCVGIAIAGWRSKQRKQIQFVLPRLNGRVEWIVAVLLALELIAIFFVSLKHTLGWDGLLNWEIKARYAFLNSGVLPESYYSSSSRAFSHPEYPLAIPLTELWLYLWMGAPHQFWIKTIFPVFYIAGALLLAIFTARLSGTRWIGFFVALLLPFVPFVLASPGGVVVGYADIPLSVFYLVALGYLLGSVESNSQRELIIYAAVLTLVPWIKSEGIILWAVLASLGLIVGFVRHRVRPFLIGAAPGFVLILAWKIYLKAMHCLLPADFARPSLHLLGENLNRLPAIFRIALIELTDTGLWSIFWIMTLVAIVYLIAARNFTRLLLITAIVGPIVLYLLTYIFSAWPSYTAHITSSLPRLLLQVMPVSWMGIALALAQSKRKEQALG